MVGKTSYVIGPTTSEVVDALLGSETEPEVTPSDLVIQYDMWMDLGATSEALGYEVQWVLGDGERWVNMNDGSQIPLPQPMKKVKISAHTTQHTVPSCAWRISMGERKGKFDRESSKHLPDDVKASLAAGNDVEYEEQFSRQEIFAQIQSQVCRSSSLEILQNRQ